MVDAIKKFFSRIDIQILLTVFFLYSLANPGNIPSDTEVRWSVARQIVYRGSLSLEEPLETRNYAIGRDGRRYCFWGLGQTVFFLPFAGSALMAERLLGIEPYTADLIGQFLATMFFFPLAGAGVVWILYLVVIQAGYHRRTAIFTAMVLAIATMHFHYSVSTQEQTQVAFFLLASLLFFIKNRQKESFLYAWLMCVMMGFSLLYRLSSLLIVLPIYIAAAGEEIYRGQKGERGTKIRKWLVAGILGVGGFVILIGWYNYVRFGSIFETGYQLGMVTAIGGHSMFESLPWRTLPAILFSPGKSILLYNPILLLLPFCIWSFWRRHRVLAWCMLFAVAGNLLLSSLYTTWAGDYAWSVRYQEPILPFLVLPLASLFNRNLSNLAHKCVLSLIVVSIVIQLASVVYRNNLEFYQNPNHNIIPSDYVWSASESHLLKRFDNIFRHITGRRDFSSVKVDVEEPLIMKMNFSEQTVKAMHHIYFFPFTAKSISSSGKLFYGLLLLWLLLLFAFFWSAFRLGRLCYNC